MAQVVVEMTGNEARLWRAYQKIIQQETKLREGMEKTAKVSKKTAAEAQTLGSKIQQSFGTQALNSLQGYATGFFSLEAGVQLVSAALHHMKGESDAALNSLKSLTDHNRRLNQVARDSADLAGLQNRADLLAAKYGVDRQVVRQTLFSGRSEGFEDYAERIIQLNQVIDPKAAATVAGQVPGLFPDKPLSSEEALDLTFVAARESRLSFEEIAQNLPKVAEGANLAGSSPEEALALTSVLASRFASGETSADRLKAFGTKVGIDPKLKGGGILNAVKQLQEGSPQARKKFLADSQELNTVFAILTQEMAKIEERQAQLLGERSKVGTADSSLNLALARAEADPNFKAARTIAQAEVHRAVNREKRLGTGQADVVAAKDNLMGDLDQVGASGFSKYLAETAADTAKDVGFNDDFTRAIGATASDLPRRGLYSTLSHATPGGIGPLVEFLLGGVGDSVGGKFASNSSALGRLNQGTTDPLADAAKDLKQASANMKNTAQRKPAVERGE